MDYSKFKYEPFENRSNVLLEMPLAGNYPEGVHISSYVKEVARTLFKRAPQNLYIFTGAAPHALKARFGRMEVWRDDVKLGVIFETSVRNRTGVCVDNHRIRAGRERGGGASTSDLKKAASMAVANFTPASTTETMRNAAAKALEMTNNVFGGPRGIMQTQFRQKADDVLKAFQNKWPTTGKQIAELVGLPATACAELDAAFEQYEAVKPLYAAGTSEKLYCVVARGSDYCLTPLNMRTSSFDGSFEVLSQMDAPATLRGTVGMLKLTEVGQYIEGRGVRVDDTTYAVIYDPKEETPDAG